MERSFAKTTVGNIALGLLGESFRLTDLDTQDAAQAQTLRLYYPFALQSSLMMYQWSFAVGYTEELEVIERDPSSGFAFSYAVPQDFVVTRQLALRGQFLHSQEVAPEDEIPFKEIVTRNVTRIHTDLELACLEYTTDAGGEDADYPSSFIKLFGAVLADIAAASIITNNFAKIQTKLDANIMKIKNMAIAEDKLRSSRTPYAPSPFIVERDKSILAPVRDADYV